MWAPAARPMPLSFAVIWDPISMGRAFSPSSAATLQSWGFAPGWYKAGPSALNITAKFCSHAFSSAESAARDPPGAEPQDLR